MDALDWEDIWNRLKGMLWNAAVLAVAGMSAGLWIQGLELRRLHESTAIYDMFYAGAVNDLLRTVAGWLHGNEILFSVAGLGWFALVMWGYLRPELERGRRWQVLLGCVLGLVVGFLIDKTTGNWGERDLWVRFGVLLGAGSFLGVGIAAGERGVALMRKGVRGGLSGGFIGLACLFAGQIESSIGAIGFSTAATTLLAPAIYGGVIGLTLRGGELLFAGPVAEQWRRFWPILVFTLVVLFNAMGSVMVM